MRTHRREQKRKQARSGFRGTVFAGFFYVCMHVPFDSQNHGDRKWRTFSTQRNVHPRQSRKSLLFCFMIKVHRLALYESYDRDAKLSDSETSTVKTVQFTSFGILLFFSFFLYFFFFFFLLASLSCSSVKNQRETFVSGVLNLHCSESGVLFNLMAGRLEVNFRRLLCRSEKMAADDACLGGADSWRLEQVSYDACFHFFFHCNAWHVLRMVIGLRRTTERCRCKQMRRKGPFECRASQTEADTRRLQV